MVATIRIKFVSKTPPDKIEPLWSALIPSGGYDGVEFTFDADAREYDVLAVYEDLPPRQGEKKILRTEPLACPRKRTLLITTEPSSIRVSGYQYLRQFGMVWSSVRYPHRQRGRFRENHPVWELAPPPLRWFYGRDLDGDNHWPLRRIEASPEKDEGLSTVCSTKAMGHTVHARRLAFTRELKARLGGEMHLFGRGFDPVDDKAGALAPYKYHIAIENHRQYSHITEKLTDAFLAECLPFYFGAPNYGQFFPAEAAIPIDIFDIDDAEATIRSALQGNEYEKRRAAILEAKAITLRDFNTLNGVVRFARNAMQDPAARKDGQVIHGRHAFRKAHPIKGAVDAVESLAVKLSPLGRAVQDK